MNPFKSLKCSCLFNQFSMSTKTQIHNLHHHFYHHSHTPFFQSICALSIICHLISHLMSRTFAKYHHQIFCQIQSNSVSTEKIQPIATIASPTLALPFQRETMEKEKNKRLQPNIPTSTNNVPHIHVATFFIKNLKKIHHHS